MNCYVKFDDKDYTVTISFKRLLKLLDLEVSDAAIDEAVKRAVLEA